MPLLNKNNLSLHKICSKEEGRYTLNAILVDPDVTVATDGHAMAICETVKESSESFPAWDSFQATNTWKPFILPAPDCADIIKFLPTKTTIPILANAAVGDRTDDSSAVIGATNLGTNRVFEAKQNGSNFPDWRRVMPAEDSFTFEIHMSAELLIEHLQLHKEKLQRENGKGRSNTAVRLKFKNKTSPMAIVSNGGEQKLTSILMPCKENGTMPVLEVAEKTPAQESPRFLARQILWAARQRIWLQGGSSVDDLLNDGTLEEEIVNLIERGV